MSNRGEMMVLTTNSIPTARTITVTITSTIKMTTAIAIGITITKQYLL